MSKISRLYIVATSLLILLFALTGLAEAAGATSGTWRIVSSANPSLIGDTLNGVAAISSNNVLAVGYSVSGVSKSSVIDQTLIEQWNGSAWSTISSPNVGTGDNVLNGVVAISANNIFAVGYSTSSTASQQTLILHYNGSSWNVMSSTTAGSLSAIAAVSASNIYAVGS